MCVAKLKSVLGRPSMAAISVGERRRVGRAARRVVSGLRSRRGEWGGVPSGWPKLIAGHSMTNLPPSSPWLSSEVALKCRGGIVLCQKRSGAFQGTDSVFDDFIDAKCEDEQMQDIGGIPTVFLLRAGHPPKQPFTRSASDALLGEAGWLLQALPKARQQLELLNSWRPWAFVVCCSNCMTG